MNEKAVLLSIQPKWCGLIASGKKTVEVRKTRPSIETPFLCYIYECGNNGRKKIVGEFVCDKITRFFECCDVHDELPNRPCEYYLDYDGDDDNIPVMACLSVDEIWHYIGKEGVGYVWHISNLIIYDKPRKLSEFNIVDNAAVLSCIHREIVGQPEYKTAHNGWIKGSYICHAGSEIDWCTKCKTKPLKRPPTSWYYVEVSGNE